MDHDLCKKYAHELQLGDVIRPSGSDDAPFTRVEFRRAYGKWTVLKLRCADGQAFRDVWSSGTIFDVTPTGTSLASVQSLLETAEL
ncbi:hypothetical protein [Candidatus Poriferisocius sp.]|uniref:hypothetical protein n=1 Tax=Candidatus Poriferisocius sp. TaxID=3101276 RepID=UPI003B0154D7